MLPTRLEMARYGKAHHAEPDKGDLAHGLARSQSRAGQIPVRTLRSAKTSMPGTRPGITKIFGNDASR
jgi:hypothetical protein